LSSVIAEQGLDRIDLLKINVEKSELDVLRGLAPADCPRFSSWSSRWINSRTWSPSRSCWRGTASTCSSSRTPCCEKPTSATCMRFGHRRRESSASGGTIGRRACPGGASPGRGGPDPTTLRAHLKARVPQYMIPSAFVLMDKFPLTSNGKVDRHALPAVSPRPCRPLPMSAGRLRRPSRRSRPFGPTY